MRPAWALEWWKLRVKDTLAWLVTGGISLVWKTTENGRTNEMKFGRWEVLDRRAPRRAVLLERYNGFKDMSVFCGGGGIDAGM